MRFIFILFGNFPKNLIYTNCKLSQLGVISDYISYVLV